MTTSSLSLVRVIASFKYASAGVLLAGMAGLALAQTAAPAAPVSGKPAEIEFGYPEQPPRAFTNAQGQADGQAIRMATALFAKAGIPWRAVSYPAPRLYKNLDDGTTTFAVMVRNAALDNCCIINSEPLYSTALNVYYIGNKPPVKSTNDLIGKRIITIRGYSYSGLINFINDPKNNIVNEVASTHEPAFEMLAAGRADYVLNYDSSASVALNAKPIDKLSFDTIDRIQTHIVLSKKYPNAKEVMARFEVILKSINAQEFFKAPAK